MTSLSRRRALQVLGGGAVVAAASPSEAAAPHAPRGRAPDDVGLLYDSTRCIGCRACVTRCKQANGLPPSRTRMNGVEYDAPADLDATTKNVIRIAQDGDRTAFVKGGCMHCIDPACINACMVGALTKRAGGIVSYDVDRCVGCRYCQVVCPFNVPKFDWTSAFNSRIVKCELCRHRDEGPACAQACPRQAIVSDKVDALLAEARRRIRANPRVYQPRVYGESEAGGTQVLYLAALPFEKLGLPELGDEPVPSLAWAVHRGVYKGFIAPVALYAAFAWVALRNRKRGKEEGP